MTLLYDRRLSLTVQEVTFSGVGSKRVAKVNPIPLSGFDPMAQLRVRAEVEKTIEPEPNRAKIEVWNLNPAHRAAVEKDYLLTLRAGYADDLTSPTGLPIIFRGNLTNVFQTKETTGWKTTFTSGEGASAYKTGRVNDLVPKDTSVSEVFDRVVNRFKELGVEVQSDLSQSILSWITQQWRKATSSPGSEGTDTGGTDLLGAPKALVGKLSDVLTQELDRVNLSWSVQNNVLVIRPKGGSDSQPPILLSPTTGLVGSPERDERGGLTGRCLLVPGVEPGRVIQVQSRVVSGEYVVAKTKLTLDTEGSDWYNDFESFIEGTTINLAGL